MATWQQVVSGNRSLKHSEVSRNRWRAIQLSLVFNRYKVPVFQATSTEPSSKVPPPTWATCFFYNPDQVVVSI